MQIILYLRMEKSNPQDDGALSPQGSVKKNWKKLTLLLTFLPTFCSVLFSFGYLVSFLLFILLFGSRWGI